MPTGDDPMNDSLDNLLNEDTALGVRVTQEPKPVRGPRWAQAVVEVLDEDQAETKTRRKRRRREPAESPGTALLNPEQARELHLALGGAMAAKNLHERAEADLERTRGTLRTAWTVAALMALAASALAVWTVMSVGEKDRAAGVAETRADMLSQQLASAKAELARLSNRADKGEDRFGDARVRLAKVETELTKAQMESQAVLTRLGETQIELNEQQGYVTQLTSKLGEQQEAYNLVRDERDRLTARLAAMSRQLLETQRELMKLRQDFGLDDENLKLPPLQTDFDKLLEEDQVGPPADVPSMGAVGVGAGERLWRRDR